MANIKITQLTEIVAPANEDVLPIVDVSGDITQKVQAANLPINTATQTALDAKQATLVSGTNIKTINSTSLLGSGDIAIAANPAGTAGQIQFSDGSAFAADSNLYWDNTNKRLGVGTSSPTAPVHINSSQTLIMSINRSDRQIVKLAGDGNDGAIVFVGSLDNQFAVGTKGNDFKIYDGSYLGGGNLRFSILSDGKTAIGEHTPTAKLHIKGTGSTAASTALLVQNSSGTELLKVRDDNRVFVENIIVNGFIGNINSGVVQIGSGGSASANAYFNAISESFGFGVSSINASAKLQVESTTKGFLPPRMTTTQKNAISSPAAGLQVYDSTTNRAAVYTSAWENVITETNGSPNSVYKLWSGSAAQYAALTPDSSTLYFVI